MPARLEVTDGTPAGTVSLIQEGSGAWFLNDWTPRIAQPKAGGVYQQSALSDGRRLVDRKFDAVAESFDIKGAAASGPDGLAVELQVLRALLEKAVAYWTTDWQSTPVYFIIQAECETNERYALIMNWSTPTDENPFSQPWLQPQGARSFDDWTLTIERDHWTENAPGTGTAVAISAVEAYNAKNYGNVDSAEVREPTTDNEVYVANKQNVANITHILVDDGGGFGHNLLDYAEVATGSYTGNGADDRWINDVEFEPDLVIIKGDTTENAVFRTSAHTGDDTSYFVAAANAADRIQAFGANGFQVGTDPEVNGNGIAYYWLAVRADAGGGFAVGNYTGNGVDNRNITGVGFRPTCVNIKGDLVDSGVFRVEENVGDDSCRYIASNVANRIQSFQNDGFQVGTDPMVNAAATEYYWFAFCDIANQFETGTYVGDGVDNRDITVGFQPDFVFVNQDGNQDSVLAIDTMDTGDSGGVDNIAPTTNSVQALEANGFEIGTSGRVNLAASDYYWYAIRTKSTTVPYDLLPETPAQNDAVYFGINTALTDSGPFASLVFDLSVAQNDCELIWEYWDSAAWSTLNVQDNTNADGAMTGEPFDTTGVNSVHWNQPSDWDTTAVNGITAYWVRTRIDAAVGAAPSPPTQQNRDVYSIVWGYTQIQANQVGGTIPALAFIRLYEQVALSFATVDTLMIGLRSISRGDDFSAYINIADEQTPTGITVSDIDATVSFVTSMDAPSGRLARWNPAGADTASIVEIDFTDAISRQYYGTFHVYMRVLQTGGSSEDFSVQLIIDYGASLTTDFVTVLAVGSEPDVLDFGQIVLPIPGKVRADEYVIAPLINVQANNTNASPGDLDFIDLILFPVDEFAVRSREDDDAYLYPRYLDIDSITYPREYIRAVLREEITIEGSPEDGIQEMWWTVANNRAILETNADQKLWFLSSRLSTSFASAPEAASTIQLQRNQRYFSYRGPN